jgi:FkbM family methyltransferase
MLNNRSIKMILRNMMRPSNYIALVRAVQVYEQPFATASRYFFGRGEYPCSVRVRTPIGRQDITLFNSHDAITLHEIFCRGDYRCPSPKVVIDIGANIGISALYFLTRSRSTYCELYEPDPHNLEKLLRNLKDHEGRFTVHKAAVADRKGVLAFTREPTGRYGTLETDSWLWNRSSGTERIRVQVEHINTVLNDAMARHGMIDLLKIDSEGSELKTLLAIDPAPRAHIRHIVIEWSDHRIDLEGFRASPTCDTIMFSNNIHLSVAPIHSAIFDTALGGGLPPHPAQQPKRRPRPDPRAFGYALTCHKSGRPPSKPRSMCAVRR